VEGLLAEERRAHSRDKGGDIVPFSVMQAIVDVCMVWDGEMRHEYLYDTCSTFIAATDAVEENTNHDGCDMEDDMEADRWGTGYMYAYR